MTFEKQMDLFFKRNCYYAKELMRVVETPAYKLAAQDKDVIKAQELVTQILDSRQAPSKP
jgi:hypothetical protein